MIKSTYKTTAGDICYWHNIKRQNELTLFFLPGLTADHRLFDKQIEFFQDKYNVLVWDAPAHGSSWPFGFDFDLMDKAKWLNGILEQEKITKPVLIGQSMGGYLAQAYGELYPEKIKGFVSIDSAPLQRSYISGMELWLLKRMEPLYYYFPWRLLLKWGSKGVAETQYGRMLMHEMMSCYNGDKRRYAKITGHGFAILAKAIEKDLPYKINCPALLICGKKDKAGSCRRYNKRWHANTNIPIIWAENAGHNANTDRPDFINHIIDDFAASI